MVESYTQNSKQPQDTRDTNQKEIELSNLIQEFKKPRESDQAIPMEMSINCMSLQGQVFQQKFDELQLKDKNVIVVIGPTRAGKGTLCAALKGHKMKRFTKKQLKEKFGLNQHEINQIKSMLPVDQNGNPIIVDFISHGCQSHTFYPSILEGPYFTKYKDLDGHHLIDFPGYFDTKGEEVILGVDLALKKLIRASKSAKIVLLLPALLLAPDNVSTIQAIKNKFSFMFDHPEQAVLIGITKLQFAEEQLGDWEDIKQLALDPENKKNNFFGYSIFPCEQDDEDQVRELAQAIKQHTDAKSRILKGFVEFSRIAKILNQELLKSENQIWYRQQITLAIEHQINESSKVDDAIKSISNFFNEIVQKSITKDDLKHFEKSKEALKSQIKLWQDIQNLEETPSLIGLIKKFNGLKDLMQLDEPAIKQGIIHHEQKQSVDLLKMCIIFGYQLLEEMKQHKLQNILTQEDSESIQNMKKQVNLLIKNEADQIKFDMDSRKKYLDTIKSFFKSHGNTIGYGGLKISAVVVGLVALPAVGIFGAIELVLKINVFLQKHQKSTEENESKRKSEISKAIKEIIQLQLNVISETVKMSKNRATSIESCRVQMEQDCMTTYQ